MSKNPILDRVVDSLMRSLDEELLARLYGEKTPVKPPTSLSAYDILGVAPSSSHSDIISAYRRQVKLCHPDVAGDSKREEFEDLQRAYKLLSDPKSRKKYDAIRKLEEKSRQQADYDRTYNPFGNTGNYQSGSAFGYYMGNSANISFTAVPSSHVRRQSTQSYLQNAFQVQSTLPANILSMNINRTSNSYGQTIDEIVIVESGANPINPGQEYFINNLPVGVIIKVDIAGRSPTTTITLIL